MGVKVELARIAIYIFGPIGLYYAFNDPDFLNGIVEKAKSSNFPLNQNKPVFPKSEEELEKLRLKFLEARKKRTIENE